MTNEDVRNSVLEPEDLSLEFVSSGPMSLPRLEGAQLVVKFSRISQNVYRLQRSLENYWKMKVGGARFPAGTQGKEDFDAIEAIVYRQSPPETQGKQYLAISLDTEAEKRIINVAVGMNLAGVSLRQIQIAFLPRKQISQILDIAKSLEETQEGEVALFEDKDRPELSALVNLSAITKSPRSNNDLLPKILADFWRIRRSDYPDWTELGPIFFDDISSIIERCLVFHLRAQYWSTESGAADIKVKAKNYVQQLSTTLQNQNNLIKINKPASSEIIWTCGWEAAAEYSGIRLPDRSNSEQLAEFGNRFGTGEDLKLLEEWILGQFGAEAADYIRTNRDSIIAPTIGQFENFVKRTVLADDDGTKISVFESESSDRSVLDIADVIGDEDVEINPFAD